MKNVKIEMANRIEIESIQGFPIRIVTKFGNPPTIEGPKEYLGQTVFLVMT